MMIIIIIITTIMVITVVVFSNLAHPQLQPLPMVALPIAWMGLRPAAFLDIDCIWFT